MLDDPSADVRRALLNGSGTSQRIQNVFLDAGAAAQPHGERLLAVLKGKEPFA
jgi:hypothetical protein